MMWPFKRTPVEVDLTNETYRQWLRAQRPPWDWFLRQPELIQAQLAILGDDYLTECVEVGANVTPPESDEDAVRRLVATAAHGLSSSKAPPPPLSMGGVSKRREDREQVEQNGKDKARSLFGRAPDAVSSGTIHSETHTDALPSSQEAVED